MQIGLDKTVAASISRVSPLVHIVVLNHNSLELTSRCIALLQNSDYPNYRIQVVDNASDDDEAGRLQHRFGDSISVTRANGNLGYAGGNNIGIRSGLAFGADLVWIVNADVTVEPGTLRGLVDTILQDERIGVVGPKFCFADRTDVVRNAGKYILPDRGCVLPPPIGFGQKDSPLFRLPALKVDYVRGSCMLMRRQSIENVGLIPECPFLYWEEVEWCHLARMAGWHVVVNQTVRAYDGSRDELKFRTPNYYYYNIRNHLHFVKSYYPEFLLDAVLRDIARIAAFVRTESTKGLLHCLVMLKWCLKGVVDALIFGRQGKLR